MDKEMIFMVFIYLLFTAIIGYSFFLLVTTEKTIRFTECYDRYGNEIQDLICEEEIYEPEWKESIIKTQPLIFVMWLFMTFSFIFVILFTGNRR